jgi:putative membrane protein
MKMISIKQTLLGLLCAGVLVSAGTLQAQPGTTTPGTVSPTTEDPTRNPKPGMPTPTDPNPIPTPTSPNPDPTAPTSPTAEPTERAPSAVRTDTGTETKPMPAAQMKQIKTTIQKIRAINATEIEAGKLAQETGTSPEVKDYGRQLVEDHQTSDKKLVEFANKHDVMVTGTKSAAEKAATGTTPTTGTTAAGPDVPEPAPLDAEGKKTLAKLRAAKADKFDKVFAKTMATGHQKALTLIKSSQNKIKHEEFGTVLGEIQSSVERHLDHAKKLEAEGPRSEVPSDEPPTRQGLRPAATPPTPPSPTP